MHHAELPRLDDEEPGEPGYYANSVTSTFDGQLWFVTVEYAAAPRPLNLHPDFTQPEN